MGRRRPDRALFFVPEFQGAALFPGKHRPISSQRLQNARNLDGSAAFAEIIQRVTEVLMKSPEVGLKFQRPSPP